MKIIYFCMCVLLFLVSCTPRIQTEVSTSATGNTEKQEIHAAVHPTPSLHYGHAQHKEQKCLARLQGLPPSSDRDGNVFIADEFGLERIPLTPVNGAFTDSEDISSNENIPYPCVWHFSNEEYPLKFYDHGERSTDRNIALGLWGKRFVIDEWTVSNFMDSWWTFTYGGRTYLFTLYCWVHPKYIVFDITERDTVSCSVLMTFATDKPPFSDTPLIGTYPSGSCRLVFLALGADFAKPFTLGPNGFAELFGPDGRELALQFYWDYNGSYDLEILSRPESSLTWN